MKTTNWYRLHEKYKLQKRKEIKDLRDVIKRLNIRNDACRDKLNEKARAAPWKINISGQERHDGQNVDRIKNLIRAGAWYIDADQVKGKNRTNLNEQVLSFKTFEDARDALLQLLDAGIWFFELKKEDG